MRPALGQHLYPAILEPLKTLNLICEAGAVGGVLAAESEVREEICEIASALVSPIHQ